MKLNLLFTIILFSIAPLLLRANQAMDNMDGIQYGLSFKSHAVDLDNRTSLELNPTAAFHAMPVGSSISFDLKLRKEQQTFGYVFRMVVDERSSFDFVSDLTEHKFNFMLNDRLGQRVASKSIQDDQLIVQDQWIPVKIIFEAQQIRVLVNKQSLIIPQVFKELKQVAFYFGANKTKYFHTSDVPPIAIRDIQIRHQDQLMQHWKLAKHQGVDVYDEVSQQLAHTRNPLWDIDKHASWQKSRSLLFSSQPQIAYDTARDRIFMVLADKIFIYQVATAQVDTIDVLQGNPYAGLSRQLVYDARHDELISYTVQNPQVSRFSLKSHRWSASPTIYVDSRQHHNHILDTTDNSIYMLMGYDYHEYHGDMLRLSLEDPAAAWKKLAFSKAIEPRYLSALGRLNAEEVLLLGGYGSKSGKQEEFPHNFYDLHQINYKTGQSKKLWELHLDTSYRVFSNSMYVDASHNRAYVLGYNNFTYKSQVLLYGFDINTKKPVFQRYGNPLPFNFLDIEAYCDLFYSSSTKQLLALTSHKGSQGQQEVSLYTIAYPVFGLEEIQQDNASTFAYKKPLLVTLLLLAAAGIGYAYWRRSKGASPSMPSAPAEIPVSQELGILRINLFGGFQVIGANQHDFSNQFTPILKQLFIYLLLNVGKKNSQSLSSNSLDQALWSNMSPEKAANNRSVNMRKLRLLLQEIGAIEISSKGGNWMLAIQEAYRCDYYQVLSILASIDQDGELTVKRMMEILALTQGLLLPSIETEWLDTLKSDFTLRLNKVLNAALQLPEIKQDPALSLKIVDLILCYDFLEENAIIYKCNILYALGQKGQSKHTFDKYAADYFQTLKSESTLDYKSIINQKL